MRHRFGVIPRLCAVAVMLGAASSSGCGGDTEAGSFNDCASSQFVDRTAAGASRTIGYGGASGSSLFTYSPKCITIAVGQTVTFTGGTTSSFGVHPLSPGVLNSPGAGTAGNPIPRITDGNMRDVTVTFRAAGTFPFICEAHASTGMTGVVRVQ
jgi:plastocyanin